MPEKSRSMWREPPSGNTKCDPLTSESGYYSFPGLVQIEPFVICTEGLWRIGVCARHILLGPFAHSPAHMIVFSPLLPNFTIPGTLTERLAPAYESLAVPRPTH